MKQPFLAGCLAVIAMQLAVGMPVAAQSLIVGRSLPLTGQLKALGEFKRDGGDAYIQKVNAAGGVGGKKIEVITLDDAYVPDNTVANLKKISIDNKPVAFMGLLRLPGTGNSLPLLHELKIPVVGLSSATDALRAQHNPYGFPVRAGFADEARKLVNHVKVTGLSKVSIIYQDVPLGQSIKALTEAALKDAGLDSKSFKLDAAAKSIDDIVGQASKEQPQAIFLGVLTPIAVAVIAELRKTSFNGAIYAFSSTDASVVAKLLGKQAAGLAISQIVPIPNGPRVQIVAEYLEAIKALGRGTQSLLGLEGYIEAKVLVEGLKRAGANPTTTSLVKGLETLRDLDLGGFFVSYTPQAHTGSLFVEVDVISAKGELIR